MNNLYTVSGDYIKVIDEHIINNKCEYFEDTIPKITQTSIASSANTQNTLQKNKVDNSDIENKYTSITTSRHYNDNTNKLNNSKLHQYKESNDNSDVENKYENLLMSRHYR